MHSHFVNTYTYVQSKHLSIGLSKYPTSCDLSSHLSIIILKVIAGNHAYYSNAQTLKVFLSVYLSDLLFFYSFKLFILIIRNCIHLNNSLNLMLTLSLFLNVFLVLFYCSPSITSVCNLDKTKSYSWLYIKPLFIKTCNKTFLY